MFGLSDGTPTYAGGGQPRPPTGLRDRIRQLFAGLFEPSAPVYRAVTTIHPTQRLPLGPSVPTAGEWPTGSVVPTAPRAGESAQPALVSPPTIQR